MRPTEVSRAPTYTPRETFLKNRAARSSSFGVHNGRAVMVGALLLIAAVAPVAGSVHRILARPVGAWNGRWWLGAYAVTFVALAGLAVLVHGVRGLRRIAAIGRRRAANAYQRWAWDYEWNEQVARDDDAMRRARQFVGIGIAMLLLLAPLQLIAFAGISRGSADAVMLVPFALITVMFDLIALAVLSGGVKLMLRQLKYGQGIATFSCFPFRVGQELELEVQAPRALPHHAVVTATLRCIQERYITTSTSDHETRTNVQCFELYRDTSPAEPVATRTGSRALRVRFAIPADAPTTDLASRPCRYWEVDLEATTEGIDYGARFLVPVY
jgi:hypothetical protein